MNRNSLCDMLAKEVQVQRNLAKFHYEQTIQALKNIDDTIALLRSNKE